MPLVTVVMPTIPERSENLLLRAMYSVEHQTVPLKDIDCHIMVDQDRELGPAALRNIGVNYAESEWVAFLDDDDELLPHHLHALLETAEKEKADVVYPWFHWAVDGVIDDDLDPLRTPTCASPLSKPFDGTALLQSNFIPVTALVRKSAFLDAGGFPTPEEFDGPEDWGLWLRLLANDAHFVHLPDRTWIWHHHDGQTGGKTCEND